jgi:hypothetical protein
MVLSMDKSYKHNSVQPLIGIVINYQNRTWGLHMFFYPIYKVVDYNLFLIQNRM